MGEFKIFRGGNPQGRYDHQGKKRLGHVNNDATVDRHKSRFDKKNKDSDNVGIDFVAIGAIFAVKISILSPINYRHL